MDINFLTIMQQYTKVVKENIYKTADPSRIHKSAENSLQGLGHSVLKLLHYQLANAFI